MDKFNWERLAKLKKMKISNQPTVPTFKHPTKQNSPLYRVFIVPQPIIIQFLAR